MIVAGVMSGTSLDGIDVAVVDIRGRSIRPLAFSSTPYSKPVRDALIGVSNTTTHTSEIARLHFLLGELYASAILRAARGRRLDLIGMHGQTIFHQGAPAKYLGHRIASTFQIGEAAVVAERTGVRVVSNFRERDVAAGGQGAPLVPFADYLLFRHPTRARVALNIGGIANLTILPPRAKPEQVVAFDTGPGNMVIDALVHRHSKGKLRFDRGGALARKGKVNTALLNELLKDPYYGQKPPKSTGREAFGRELVNRLLATNLPMEDLIATAAELTARTIAAAIPSATKEVIAAGGGVHNRAIMHRLSQLLPGAEIATTAKYGIDPDAKEAIAFALLAYQAVHGRSGNVPSATGARRAVVLGKITP